MRSDLSAPTAEEFARFITESINKALDHNECPVKEKHVRRLLIASHKLESAKFFWDNITVRRLLDNQIASWKFCYVVHKLLRDGHSEVVHTSLNERQTLTLCRNMWRHVGHGYGKLIEAYCTLLINRINFLSNNPILSNDLRINEGEQLAQAEIRDIGFYYNLTCEIFDSLDDIIELQEQIMRAMERKKFGSMTSAGQCHLAPLVPCIQDSSLLYDCSVKMMSKLFSTLSPDALVGHEERFGGIHRWLKKFYDTANILQYLKTLIQIPVLSAQPPNFKTMKSSADRLIASQVVMIAPSEVSQNSNNQSYDSQLVNVDDTPSMSSSHVPEAIRDIFDSPVPEQDQFSSMMTQDSIDAGSSLAVAQQDDKQRQADIAAMQSKIDELSTMVATQEAAHLAETAQHEEKIKQLETKVSEYEIKFSTMKDDMARLKSELRNQKRIHEKCNEREARLLHDTDIAETAMRKVYLELSAVKAELETHRLRTTADASKSDDSKVIAELNAKISQLTFELEQSKIKEQQLLHELTSYKEQVEKLDRQIVRQQEDVLTAEMNDTDQVIKEATLRIEQLSEQSRQKETGLKLQVNEKISDVCSNLMRAVRNLIIQSRLLQREIVGDSDSMSNNTEFYKQNSSWTEGLISAAHVVAMAARALVDSADRTMSSQARFTELAAAAHQIATATTQLVVASRVKANKDSEKLKVLLAAAKQVSQCTTNVVDTARICSELVEQEVDKLDFATLSLHETKKLEMETQVKMLELEEELSKTRTKLGVLRRQHYQQEDAQIAPSSGAK